MSSQVFQQTKKVLSFSMDSIASLKEGGITFSQSSSSLELLSPHSFASISSSSVNISQVLKDERIH